MTNVSTELMIDNLKHVRRSERDALLGRIETTLREDLSVVAVWLAGSLGRGDADALSDIDLWIVVADDAISAIAADPHAFVAPIVDPCLVIEAPQNAPSGGAYLFTHVPGETGAHQVDWYWQAVSHAARPADTKLLFERIAIPIRSAPSPLPDNVLVAQLTAQLDEFWAVVLIAAKLIARGKHRSVHRNFEYLSSIFRTIRLLLDRGAPPCFDDVRHPPLPELLPTSASEQLELLDTFIAEVETMEPEIARRGVTLSGEAKHQVLGGVVFVRSLLE